VIHFTCPSCSQPVAAPPARAGAETVCPHCRRPVRVPNPLAEPTDRPAPQYLPSGVVAYVGAVAAVVAGVGVLGLLVLWHHVAAMRAASEKDIRRPLPVKQAKTPGAEPTRSPP
jgi:hypothetical protein